MGLLVNGEWRDDWYDTQSTGGRFVREKTTFRGWIRRDTSSEFPAQPGRYHLYVSKACPWAHRTLIFRQLKGLQSMISVCVVDPLMKRGGWRFSDSPGSDLDTLNGAGFLHEVYTIARPDYSGRVTVPVLWDKIQRTIVNNESAEIIRMFNSEFDDVGAHAGDFYPAELRAEIDEINAVVYENVNNGVYRSGFATTQQAYEEAVSALFATLDGLEARLSRQPFLMGQRLTEADWRLFTTLVRFDPVYVGHFKCNLRRLCDYPNLWAYTRALYQMPGIAQTVDFSHIKEHYYRSHETINPTGVVPVGPMLELDRPHDRDRLMAGSV